MEHLQLKKDCFNKIAHRRSRRPLGLGTSNNTDQPSVEWFYAKVARKLACMVANDLAVLVLILFFFSFLSFAFSRSTTRGHPKAKNAPTAENRSVSGAQFIDE
uniref:Transmembrane protein n=1 Tax=Anopheles coluzzii TaxID=1518534 RepID=A0A8W7PNE7_ANOCL